MIKKILNNRFLVLYIVPFLLGLLTVFSFQPFNFSLINFFVMPSFFLLICYVKEKSKSTGNTNVNIEKFDITNNFKSTENFRSTENFGKKKASSSNYLTWLMYIGIAIVLLVCIILITKIN